jgi:hypothetical protein
MVFIATLTQMISCTENVYSFITDPFGINAGIYKTYLVDINGDNVKIFNAIDYFVDSTFNPYELIRDLIGLAWFMVFIATLNNMSVISWQSVLMVEETGGPRENQ